MTKLEVSFRPLKTNDIRPKPDTKTFDGKWEILPGGVLSIVDGAGMHVFAGSAWLSIEIEPDSGSNIYV